MINKVKTWADEFKAFAVRGNVIDMAVGIIIGASFGKIVDSLVNDIIMPPLGWIMGKVDFTNLYFTLPTKLDEIGAMPHYDSLEAAKSAGAVTINYGVFINTLISFTMVAFAVFLLIKAINKLKAAADKEAAEVAPATKVCPKCYSEININATRCPHCTSEI
ncbi:MAG: large-conductance mechanosensitive channel protein MscL [Candidatus Gastranaerophilales bacterium]|nr:large-conductance mechanosensitive channel protein MscL [Candidatus Gastranaerophilales bacterium]